jgi:hypothetical protein
MGWLGVEKKEISEVASIKSDELLFAESGSYYGGHLEHSVEKFVNGYLGITADSLFFVNIAILRKNKWFIRIPFRQVILNEVKEKMEDIYSTKETIAGIYALGGLGMKDKQNIITIPHVDENGVKHESKFSVSKKHREKFSKLLYERLSKLAKRTEISGKGEEDPLQILKIRYAKGEISKKEYEEMKKELMR